MKNYVTAIRRSTPVLMYHSISAQSSPSFQRYCVDPHSFDEQLHSLAAAGFTTATVSELVEAMRGGVRLAERSVVITFDDAFADFHELALPALVRHGFTASLFVPTAYVGGTSRWLSGPEADRQMLDWVALQEVAAAGIEIGSHSHTHPHLDLSSDDELRAETADSRAILEDRLQRPVHSFAYSYGHFDRRARRAVETAGYRCACAVRDLTCRIDDDPYAVPRLTVTHDLTVEKLLRRVTVPSGPARALHAMARGQASAALRRSRAAVTR